MKVFNLFFLVLAALFNTAFSEVIPDNRNISIDDSLKIVEKVYLHLDRESYYPGDDIWFKAYLVDASERLLCSNSINLHVELISSGSKIIDSRIVRLDSGLGNGDFHLSEKLQSGKYRLRAYTNYMRNFGDQLFFNKDITIINSSDAAKAFSDTVSYDRNKPYITFFPEGGSLVENVTSKVAFKAVDYNGIGQEVSGEIYSPTGEKVTEFTSTHSGMGSFSLNPAPGLSYFAIVKSPNGDSSKYEVPKGFPTGVVLNISENQPGLLSLIFKTNPETFPLMTVQDLSVTVSARNVAFKTYSFRMKSLNSFLNISTQDLPDGIVMLSLSGGDNIPLCERLVSVQNKEEVKVKVETEKSEYKKRDSVSVKISLKADSTIPQDAFLSLSATDNLFLDNSSRFPSNISSWFLLESDVHGPVEEPSYYFDSSNPDRLKDLDLLLLTQGWRDFRWKYDGIFYPPEYGFTISGRVRKKISDIPLKNSTINIAIFKTGNPFITTIKADSLGRFCVKGLDINGKAKLIVSATSGKDQLQGWLILDSLSYLPPTAMNSSLRKTFLLTPQSAKKEKNTLFVQYAQIKNSIRKKYKLTDTVNIGEVTITAKRQDSPNESTAHRNLNTLFADREMKITPQEEKYGTVSQLMNVKLNNISISGVRITKKALILLDGMPVEYDGIAAIPVSMIERVDILGYIEGYRSFGERGGAGVISFTTKSDWGSTSINYHSVNIKISGYNESRIFYSPRHHNTLEKDFKPDLRTTLFWEPNIKVENKKEVLLNYYNADNPSKVKIIVEGITSTGIPVTGNTEYEVK
jgi:hypothetical protein